MSKYFAIFKVSFRHSFRNYKAWIGLSIFLIICLIIFSHLWQVVAARRGVVNLTAVELLWYIALNEWILISLPDIQEDMEEDLQSGRLAYLLPRPISYLGATLAEALGALAVNLIVLGTISFLFVWWQMGMLPFQLSGVVFSIFFAVFSGIVGVLFLMLIGISSFWIRDVAPIHWMFEKLLLMLGGLMLPLSIYPYWIQKLASFTPFPSILGDRSALALNFNLNAVTSLFMNLTFWAALALTLLFVLYRRGLKILNIEGG